MLPSEDSDEATEAGYTVRAVLLPLRDEALEAAAALFTDRAADAGRFLRSISFSISIRVLRSARPSFCARRPLKSSLKSMRPLPACFRAPFPPCGQARRGRQARGASEYAAAVRF